jgi:hypothetical protein
MILYVLGRKRNIPVVLEVPLIDSFLCIEIFIWNEDHSTVSVVVTYHVRVYAIVETICGTNKSTSTIMAQCNETRKHQEAIRN